MLYNGNYGKVYQYVPAFCNVNMYFYRQGLVCTLFSLSLNCDSNDQTSSNDILGIEIEAAGTEFAANSDSQNAFATLFEGDRWMIFRNAVTGVLHWDFVSLKQLSSFTPSLKLNIM